MHATIARPPKIYRLAPTSLPRAWGPNARLIADALRRRPSAIFTDIDGTLSPIVATPSEATVRQECREALRALTPYVDLLCVLSGRPADEAWRMVRIDEALYVGNHGAERWFRGELLRPPGIERFHARLARAHAMLRLSLANVPGLVFEDKGIGFAVHGRIVLLYASIVAAAEQSAVAVIERGADRDASFDQADARLIDGGVEQGAVVGSGDHGDCRRDDAAVCRSLYAASSASAGIRGMQRQRAVR